MTIIRQTSLFSIRELYDIEPTTKYEVAISAIDLHKICREVMGKSLVSAP